MLAVLGGKLPNLQRLKFRIAHFPDNDILNNCINNIHEKLLDSDWLRAVQFKCNTNEILDYDWLITIGFGQNQSNLLFSNQARALDGAIFPWLRDTGSFFMSVLLISNHMIFQVQFRINKYF